MNPVVMRLINAPTQRFFKTSDTSLQQYLMILHKELMMMAEACESNNEALWYGDASCLVLEVLLRYEEVKPTRNYDHE